ncbi:hypothetical protein [Micromonospora costi]|uniref:HAF repeat-containing protein n=1 Tax=Micromonospora costi TaxID=1530042 RepID=A0A3A9ZU76_9ACTN|nr:hypothetical protein [Micromonospora costi]RKN51693.1 hypothetical protein D7193_27575 [Micromonospora costi]
MPHSATRATVVVAGLLAAVAVAPVSPAGAFPRPRVPSCAIETLAQPAGMYRTEAYAVDPSGRYVAGGALRVTDEGTESFVLLWDRGRLRTIASPLGEYVVDVNIRGVVVGNGHVDGRSQPWTYHGGVFTHLATLPGGVFADAVNARGDVVGYGYDEVSGEPFAVRWPASRPGTVERLDAPAGAMALGITRDGSIVGTAGGPEDFTGWVRRPGGAYDTLTVPGARSVQVDAAQGRWVVGRADLADGSHVPVRWNLRTGRYAALAPEVGVLTDVNGRGVAIGGEWVVRGATARQLPGGGARTVGARAIADDGTVVGFRNDGRVSAVRWTGC